MKKKTVCLIIISLLGIGLVIGGGLILIYKDSPSFLEARDEKQKEKFVGLWRSETPNQDGTYDMFWLKDGKYIEGSDAEKKVDYNKTYLRFDDSIWFMSWSEYMYEIKDGAVVVTWHIYSAFANEEMRARLEESEGHFYGSSFEERYGERREGWTGEIEGDSYTILYEKQYEEKVYTIADGGSSLLSEDGIIFTRVNTNH